MTTDPHRTTQPAGAADLGQTTNDLSSSDDHRAQDPSTSQLISQASEQVSRLVRDELQLAQAELTASGKRLGMGVGLFGTAGVIALYGLGALTAAAILGIAEGLAPWIAALIVAVALFVVAGIAALIGKSKTQHVADGPKRRVESVKTDVAEVKEHRNGHN